MQSGHSWNPVSRKQNCMDGDLICLVSLDLRKEQLSLSRLALLFLITKVLRMIMFVVYHVGSGIQLSGLSEADHL